MISLLQIYCWISR